jgi:GNAT superfamily N-acetyltransferase
VYDEVVVRLATPVEYDAVGKLTLDVYVHSGLISPTSGYVPTLANATDRAAHTDLLVAVVRDQVAGAVAYCPPGSPYAELAGPHEAEIRMLAVHPDARNRGIGRALVEACLTRAHEAGLSGIRLSTQLNMPEAQRLYVQLGFVRTPDRDWSTPSGKPLITFARTFGA